MDRDLSIAMDELKKIDKKHKRKRVKKGPRIASSTSPFYGLSQVLALVPISRSNLYIMIANGEFPKQIKLGKRAAVWSKSDIHNWIDEKLGK